MRVNGEEPSPPRCDIQRAAMSSACACAALDKASDDTNGARPCRARMESCAANSSAAAALVSKRSGRRLRERGAGVSATRDDNHAAQASGFSRRIGDGTW